MEFHSSNIKCLTYDLMKCALSIQNFITCLTFIPPALHSYPTFLPGHISSGWSAPTCIKVPSGTSGYESVGQVNVPKLWSGGTALVFNSLFSSADPLYPTRLMLGRHEIWG